MAGEGGGNCQGTRERRVGSEARAPSPRPAAPARGPAAAPDARGPSRRSALRAGPADPALTGPAVLPRGAAGAEPCALALPPSPLGRRAPRFLPDASRRPAAPPAERAGRPGSAEWAAGRAPGRRPLRAQGAGPSRRVGGPRSDRRAPAEPGAAPLPPGPPRAPSSGDAGGSRLEARALRGFPLLS